jgi:hypothetical protein
MIATIGAMLLLMAGAAHAQEFTIQGVSGAELKIPLGARPAGMGEAFAGLADDMNAGLWNPAGLAQMAGYQVGLLHSNYFQDISMKYLAYAQSVFPGAGVGAYLTYFNYGSMDKVTEVNGVPVMDGSFSADGFTAVVSYGQWLAAEKMALGGAVKFFSQTIDGQSASAAALDLAALYRTGLNGLQLGLALQNVGTPIAGFDLPVNFKAGAAYEMPFKSSAKDSWKIMADLNAPLKDSAYISLSLGTEYSYNQMLAGRLGYTIKNNGNLSGLTGLTAGVGVKLGLFSVDYAMVTFGDLGLTHQIMLSADFGVNEPGASTDKKNAKEDSALRGAPDVKTKNSQGKSGTTRKQ